MICSSSFLPIIHPLPDRRLHCSHPASSVAFAALRRIGFCSSQSFLLSRRFRGCFETKANLACQCVNSADYSATGLCPRNPPASNRTLHASSQGLDSIQQHRRMEAYCACRCAEAGLLGSATPSPSPKGQRYHTVKQKPGMHQGYNADIPTMKEISERQVRLQVEAI